MRTAGFLVSFVLLAGFLQSASVAAPEAVVVRIRSVDGRKRTGRLRVLDGKEVRVQAADGEAAVALGDLVGLEVEVPGPSTLGGQDHLRVSLVGGEILLGTWAGTVEGGFFLETPELGRIRLPLDVVRTLVTVPADAGPCHEPEHRHRPTEDDAAYVHSGDSFSGIVLVLDDEGVAIETDQGRVRRVGWTDLAVLQLQNDLPPPAEGVVLELETVEGARLVAHGEVALAESHLRLALRSLPDRPLGIPLSGIRALGTHGGSFVYASDLPFESEFTPYYREDEASRAFLAQWFEARADRRPTGCPLRLDGKVYRHGFAVHSRSRVKVQIGGAFKTFTSLFGVDDEALEVEAGGIVDARILGDDRVLWSAEGVRAGATPRRIGPLDIEGVQELVLEVDFGAALHVRDRATWADPLLVRK